MARGICVRVEWLILWMMHKVALESKLVLSALWTLSDFKPPPSGTKGQTRRTRAPQGRTSPSPSHSLIIPSSATRVDRILLPLFLRLISLYSPSLLHILSLSVLVAVISLSPLLIPSFFLIVIVFLPLLIILSSFISPLYVCVPFFSTRAT